MNAAAIVVTYNSARQIDHCLSALVDDGLETWVVDNASADETARRVAELFPAVHLLHNAENCGFARAVNQALARTETDAVLLVNPDCVVPAATVRELIVHLERHPQTGIVGPRLRDATGRIAISAHPFEHAGTVLASRFGAALLPRRLRRLLARERRHRSYVACETGKTPIEVDWLSGACLAIRGSLLRGLGGLDEGYFMYYEDEELCVQAWRAGASVVYLPAVEACHAGGSSSGDPAHVWPHLYHSLLRFHARHRPRTYALLRVALFVRALLGIASGSCRDLVALGRGTPPRRALAWARIARMVAIDGRALQQEASR
jgi:GT2 family glycosyltransferase